jgi:hypothetical protein
MDPKEDFLIKDRIDWTPTLIRKIFMWAIIVIAAICGLMVFIGYLEIKKQEYDLKQEQVNYRKLVIDTKKMEDDFVARSKADTFGGKTPEETINLLIEALMQKDVELAVKYFSINTQLKARKNLQDELNDNLTFTDSINYFTEVKNQGEKTCSSNESCSFSYTYVTTEDKTMHIEGSADSLFVLKGSERTKVIDLIKNTYTNIWKVVEH